MQWKNSDSHFGTIAVSFHWLVAVTVFGLFAVGLWMTGLDYYDTLYRIAPWWHKSIGIALFAVVVLRLVWRFISRPPTALDSHQAWEVRLASVAHGLLYLLLCVIMFSGYLISTADGRAIEVFGWFDMPATITSVPNQEDVAGLVHKFAAFLLIGLVVLHAAAALKHHFIDRDRTLLRILGR